MDDGSKQQQQLLVFVAKSTATSFSFYSMNYVDNDYYTHFIAINIRSYTEQRLELLGFIYESAKSSNELKFGNWKT